MNAPVVPQEPAEAVPSEPSLSWACAFAVCGKLRIFEGGRPELFRHLDTCNACGSRVAVAPTDRAVIAALVAEHLL